MSVLCRLLFPYLLIPNLRGTAQSKDERQGSGSRSSLMDNSFLIGSIKRFSSLRCFLVFNYSTMWEVTFLASFCNVIIFFNYSITFMLFKSLQQLSFNLSLFWSFNFKFFKQAKKLLKLSGIQLNNSVKSNFTQHLHNQNKYCFQTFHKSVY